MDTLKSLVKMILGLLGGALIGLVIAGLILVCFSDMSLADYFGKMQSASFLEAMMAAGMALLAFIASVVILIPLHEAGHLVCGLLTGYKFVSFRIFNLTFIKSGDKLVAKRFSIAGTGGQCLLTPPDKPLEQIPTGWYNFGGVLFNIIALFAVAPLLLIDNPFVKESTVIFLLTDLFLIIMNGIPMKISGAGNDAYNMLALRKNRLAKRGLVEALRANALIQNGVRPKDMPAEWYEVPAGINYGDQLEVSIPMMAASRMVDELNFPEALKMYESIYSHRGEIIGLYVKEIECELLFLRLVEGEREAADALRKPELMKYIETYRKVMSSKERVLCAVALIVEEDRDKATEIYRRLLEREQDYLLQGEVKSDLAVMKSLLAL